METTVEQETIAPDPPRFRWLRRMFVLTVVWAAAMLGLWKGWHASAQWRLRAEMDALRARGEPVELVQARPTMPFDHRSAGADVAAAARSVANFNRGRGIESGGRARRLPAEPPEADAAPRVAEIFQTSRRAATRPLGPLPSPMLTGMRELSEMLRASAIRRHQVRRDRESVELLAALLQQADVTFVSGASVTFHQRGVETRAAAASAAAFVAPGLHIRPERSETSVTPDDVRDLIRRLLDESHMAASLTRAWQGERVYRIYTARSPVYGQPPIVVYRHGMIRAIRHTTDLIEASRGATFPRERASEITPPLPPQSALDRWARAASNVHRDRDWSPALFAHYHALADGRAAAIHLAIRLYALDHDDAPPATLDALVPAYLAEVPRDPFGDGQRPIMYRPSEGMVVLGSVGPNGVDDSAIQSGDLASVRVDRARGLARQVVHDDIVYPMILPGESATAPSSR